MMATLYSPKHGIALLHIPKTGGTARQRVLRDVGFGAQNKGSGHVRLHDFQRFLRIQPHKLRAIVAVIRNPYEHVVSSWAFANQQNVRGRPGDQWWHIRQCETADGVAADWQCWPEQYYERNWHRDAYQHENGSVPDEMDDPFRYWITIDSEVPDNVQVVRLEDQEAALSELLEHEVQIPVAHTSKHGPWRNELSAAGIAAVNERYAWTFESGYYSMELVGNGNCIHSCAGR